MLRFVSALARLGLGITLFLLVLAVTRWAPIHAEPPWDVRALRVAPLALACAVAAALTGQERRHRNVRPLVLGLAASVLALAVVVAVRPASGLSAWLSDARGGRDVLAPGPVDLVGSDIAPLPKVRRRMIVWDGALRAPESGLYRLWLDGRGLAKLELDGRPVLQAEGDPARAGVAVDLERGEHHVRVSLEQVGGPRLRLGWTRPGGRSEMIPPRALGPARATPLWLLTDVLALVVAALFGLAAAVAPWDRPRVVAAPRPVTRDEIGLSLAGHAALVALMSWPLVLSLASAGPLDRPDGRLNTWILAWDVHAVLHEPGRLFQAPIFHPLPDALTFTENLLLPAMVVAPAIVYGSPILGYNLVLLGSAVVSGLGAQLLVRRANGDRLAAFVAGAAFGVGAHRWFRLAHLHAEVTLFLPFALLALDRYWERRTLSRALAVGLLLACQGLSSVYLGAITATTLAVGSGLALLARPRWGDALRLGMGFALAGLLLAPVAGPYLRMRAFQGMEFSLADQANYATTIRSYAASATALYGAVTERELDLSSVRDPLFPGLVPLALGVIGIASAPARFRAVAVVASALAVTLSLGPETGLYRFLHEHVVFFRGIRALSRFSLVPVLALAVLSGFALAGRGRLALASLVLLLFESHQIPLRTTRYEPPSSAARWLAGRPGAVVDLPIGPQRDTQVMLDGLAHHRPLLNGDSGFIPRAYDRSLELLEGSLDADGLRYLRAVGVTHVVTRDERDLPLAARFGDERVWSVPDGARAGVPVAGTPVAALWGPEGVIVDLGAARDLERIAFELSDRPWQARPVVTASVDGVDWRRVAATASLADATLALTREPRHALGEIRLAACRARYLRVDPRLPARPGLLWVGP
jgi:hypothetical protein